MRFLSGKNGGFFAGLKRKFCYKIELMARKIQYACIDKKTWEEVEQSYEQKVQKSERFTRLERHKDDIFHGVERLRSEANMYRGKYEEALYRILTALETARNEDCGKAVLSLERYIKRLEQRGMNDV